MAAFPKVGRQHSGTVGPSRAVLNRVKALAEAGAAIFEECRRAVAALQG